MRVIVLRTLNGKCLNSFSGHERKVVGRKRMSSRIRNYGFAVSATLLAWAVDILLEERFSESSAGLYLAAALASTWLGGWRPGLLAIGFSIGLNLAFYDHPYLSLAVGVYG